MKNKHLCWLPGSLVLLCVMVAPLRAQHSGDLWIGVSETGQIILDIIHGFDPDETPVRLSEVNGPFFWGWTLSNPGFDHITMAYPELGFYPLDSGAGIWLEVVSIDPALYIVIPPTYTWLDGPGQSTRLGDGGSLHKHLIWHIDSTDPAYDPAQVIWEVTLILRDERGAGGHATSAPFTLRFITRILIPGDLDYDGDVDMDDFEIFERCRTAPGIAPAGKYCEPEVEDCKPCSQTDLDKDGDVDQDDFAVFQRCYSGAGNPGDPNCAG